MKFRSLSFYIAAVLMGAGVPVFAQQEHQHMHHADSTQTKAIPAKEGSGNHHLHDMAGSSMSHAFSLQLPMQRNRSGTGWQPDATPMYAYMKHGSAWNYMLHGSIFMRYTSQNFNHQNALGSLSDFSFNNWFMGMAQRKVGKNGLLTLRGMISLDRIVDGGDGYPLLFQTGETWKGIPLLDRQHPHDLFSELSIGYTHRINDKVDVTLYAGYPGEPALGPTAFMHRMSAFNNPDAVLGHHWQDATHITFGVVTAGVRYGKFKLETSRFTGREPDENRFNFDKPTLNSYSYRLLYNPSKNWALQVSHGLIKSPEPNHPSENTRRTTASIQHVGTLPQGPNKWIATSIVWGYNDAGSHHQDHSLLLESNLQLNKWAIYGRFEWVQKDLSSWNSYQPPFPMMLMILNEPVPVTTTTIGINRQIASFSNTLLQAGAQLSHYTAHQNFVKELYGNHPLSGQVYLRLTPGRM